MGPGASVTDRTDRGPDPDGWLHERAVCLRQADSISESIVNSQERERTMEPERLDTFVSSGKTKRSTRKPKARRGFIGVKFFGPEKVFFHLTGTYMDGSLRNCQSFSCVAPRKDIENVHKF